MSNLEDWEGGVPFHQWTSCEVHGHVFRDDDGPTKHCTDCGEENYDFEEGK